MNNISDHFREHNYDIVLTGTTRHNDENIKIHYLQNSIAFELENPGMSDLSKITTQIKRRTDQLIASRYE